MKGKHLRFYESCMQTGVLPPLPYLDTGNGLCSPENNIDHAILGNFNPTEYDRNVLVSEGMCAVYWASGMPDLFENLHERAESFTPLRQTIVLFMAAINGEL